MNFISLSQTVNPAYQHIINQSAVFHYLRQNGPTYRNQISTDLKISLPSVTRALNALVERGFVELLNYRKNFQARTVPYYHITIKENLMLSIDLLKGAIAARDIDGLISISYFRLNKSIPVSEDLQKIITNYVEISLGRSCNSIRSICIGSPGIVDVIKGKVVKAIFHPGLEGVQLKKIIADRFNCSVFLDNVVNIAAYANFCEFNRRVRNIVSCDIGLEIGTGILINGNIYRGENYMAGETGFYIDNLENPSINYKRTHTFRSICSEMAQLTEGKKLDPAKLEEDYCLQETSKIFELAHKGDKNANTILNSYIRKIALMLNKVEVLLNPSIIVIGGDVCQMPFSEEIFLTRLQACFCSLHENSAAICYSKYGPLVTLYGAGEMALENYFFAEFPYMMGEKNREIPPDG